MNVKKTMLFAVALATVATTSFAAKSNPDLQAKEEKEQVAADKAVDAAKDAAKDAVDSLKNSAKAVAKEASK